MKYVTFTKYIEIPVRCRVPIIAPDPSVGLFSYATEEPELFWEFFTQEMPSELVDYVLQEHGEAIHVEALERVNDEGYK